MFIYWFMLIIPASFALLTSGHFRKKNYFSWYMVAILFILIIGPRLVGGDLGNYMAHFLDTQGLELDQALKSFSRGDPAYQFINWLFNDYTWGFYAANTVFASIFTYGLIRFSRDQINPWIAFTVAVPYLVIVVAMGYTRQSVAIGLFMLAITYLRKGKLKTYLAIIFIAALFHKTAVLMMPLGFFLYGSKGWFWRVVMLIPIMYGAWDLVISQHQDQLIKNYVDAEMQSSGAKIRVALNLLPALLLFVYRKEWKKSFNDYPFWFWIALGSVVMFGLVGVASTAVDRMALYFIPIQLAVFARLPYLARNNISPKLTKILIIFFYIAVLFVWLNFASHSYMWIPYKNILFDGLW